MVLKYLVSIIIIFSTSLIESPYKGPLLSNYESAIFKQLSVLKSDQLNIDKLDLGLHNLEAYTISSRDENMSAYLFIKEVKACSLNGCIAKTKSKEDKIGSEYYDISVLTDSDKKILSIKVLDYFSDYGYQITSKRYLKKYKHLNLCDFNSTIPKVDGISGATISYNGLINSLIEFCNLTD